jgi:sodium transport system ATP-binding protein
MIYGLMKPDGGRIEVDGLDIASNPLAVQARLGVLPDTSGLYPRLTAREHVRYFGRLQGLNGADLEGRIGRWIELLDMRETADRRVAGFSHGERTKVALARALVHEPQNILLDEPTNGLDVMSTRTVRDLIRRLRADGKCVLFSSHVMQEVSALCDHIIVIAKGRVAAEGSSDYLLSLTGKSSLEDAFVALSGHQEVAE